MIGRQTRPYYYYEARDHEARVDRIFRIEHSPRRRTVVLEHVRRGPRRHELTAFDREDTTQRLPHRRYAMRAYAIPRSSDLRAADAGADEIDERDGQHDDDDDRRRLGVLEAANVLVERKADAAGADNAEHSR